MNNKLQALGFLFLVILQASSFQIGEKYEPESVISLSQEQQQILEDVKLGEHYDEQYKSDQYVYFQTVLDSDNDDKITLKEWYNAIMTLEYEEGLTLRDVEHTFNFYDTDNDGLITFDEFVGGSNPHLLKEENKLQGILGKKHPSEFHLSLTDDDTEMQIMWVIASSKSAKNPVVQYGKNKDNLEFQVRGTYHTYNKGIGGFHGLIYVAYMKNLEHSSQYYYRVGDFKQQIFSEVKPFRTSPKKGEHLDFVDMVMYGDQGYKIPFGGPVNDMVIKHFNEYKFNMTFLVGDVAYAGQGSEKQGSITRIWDLYAKQNEPWASQIPFMPGVGNHEKYYNYTSYKNRYVLPRSEGSGENFWFSFDYGQIHFVHMSTEHPYHKGSPQYTFLENDLKKARLDRNTQWIVFGGHRPFLSSQDDEVNQHMPGSPLISTLEKLINKYKVDLVMNGHMHCYERIHPNLNGKVTQRGNVYNNPQNPVYIVQGTAGAIIRTKWLDQPDWSAYRESKYGYGRFRLYGNNTLHYQFVRYPGDIADEFWLNKSI